MFYILFFYMKKLFVLLFSLFAFSSFSFATNYIWTGWNIPDTNYQINQYNIYSPADAGTYNIWQYFYNLQPWEKIYIFNPAKISVRYRLYTSTWVSVSTTDSSTQDQLYTITTNQSWYYASIYNQNQWTAWFVAMRSKYIAPVSCPTFTGVQILYNATSYETTKNIMLQNTTFEKFEDDDYVYFNAQSSNNIVLNDVPVDYTWSTFIFSWQDFQVNISWWVLYITDIPAMTWQIFTWYLLTWIVQALSWSTFTWNAFEWYYNQILGAVLDNLDLILIVWFILLSVIVLWRMLFPRRRF